MGLLLKSLKQIDWRPAEVPIDDAATQLAEPAPQLQIVEPQVEQALAELTAAQEAAQLAEQLNDAILELEQEAQEQAETPDEIFDPELLVECGETEKSQASEPESIELPPPEPVIQSAESTLDRLNELHELIDAALRDLSNGEPIVVEPPAGDASGLEPAIAWEQLAEQEPAVEFSPVDAATTTVVPPPEMPARVVPVIPLSPPVSAMPLRLAPAVKVRDEYRELRDHLLARFRLDEPSTLLTIDAGRVTNDASWLAPFAACLWETLSKEPMMHVSTSPRILLVEAAGPECGIARHLGLDCPLGLADVLRGTADWPAAIQPTYHPQIDLLSRGKAALQPNQSAQFVSIWSDLQRRYQAILVAAGPWEAPAQASWRKTGMATAAMLLPLADAAVVCVELDATPQSVAVDTKRALQRRGVRLLGCVVRGR